MQETWVQSLGQEDPLEKQMTTHSNILAWRISWTVEPGELQSMVSKKVGHNLATKKKKKLSLQFFFLFKCDILFNFKNIYGIRVLNVYIRGKKESPHNSNLNFHYTNLKNKIKIYSREGEGSKYRKKIGIKCIMSKT